MKSRLSARLCCAFLMCVVAPAAFAADKAPEFARVDTDSEGMPRALQMSIATYVPADGNGLLEVDLVGAIHIGDPVYYAELNRRFEDYDVLLYELIAPPDAVRSDRVEGRKGILSTTQVGMTKLLDLSFQLDEIRYDAANFVHADLSPTELRASMAERGESLYVYFWRIFFATMKEYARDPLGLRDVEMLSGMIAAGQDVRFGLLQEDGGAYVLEHIHPGHGNGRDLLEVEPEMADPAPATTGD